MKVLGVNLRDLILAFVLGRIVKKKQRGVSGVVIGTNLGLGLAALYWLTKRRVPAHLPVVGRARIYAFLREQAIRRL